MSSERRSARLIPAGAMILTAQDARILYQVAGIRELRNRYRIGDNAIYQLLTDLTVCAFTEPANDGTIPRQPAASGEAEQWTVQRIAKAVGLAARTVRLDIQRGALPATKHGTTWLTTPADAATYIQSRKKRT